MAAAEEQSSAVSSSPATGAGKQSDAAFDRFMLNCGGYFQRSMNYVWREFGADGLDKGFSFVEGSDLRPGKSAPQACGEPRVLIRDAQRGMWIQLYDTVAMMSVDSGSSWFRFTPMDGCDSSGHLSRQGESKEMSVTIPQFTTKATQACWSPEWETDRYINVINKSLTFSTGRSLSQKYFQFPTEVDRSALCFPSVSFKLCNGGFKPECTSSYDELIYEHHVQLERMYSFAWGLAIKNITQPPAGSKVRHAFADAAFNDCLFMWDSIFMLEFWRWNPHGFAAQRGLDNFYSTQVGDGYISREMTTAGEFRWHPSHPCGTGPNLFAWSELRHFAATADSSRVGAVLPHIAAYHRWTRANRSWQNGSYWNTGYGSGMDNQPRCPPSQIAVEAGGDTDFASHWHMAWVDATAQALLSAVCILTLLAARDDVPETAAGLIGGQGDLLDEAHALAAWLFANAWDDGACWYCDVDRRGKPTGIKSAAGWWAVLALSQYTKWCTASKQQAAFELHEEANRVGCMAAHLSCPDTFGRKHLVPSLSADSNGYSGTAGYWRGGVWPPTTYLAVLACAEHNLPAASEQITSSHLACCAEVYHSTGSIWENYAPDLLRPGEPARRDFVGWGGLGPIALLLQEVCGLQWDAQNTSLRIAPRHSQGFNIRQLQLLAGDTVYECDVTVEPALGQATSQLRGRVAVRVLRSPAAQKAAGSFKHTFVFADV